MSDGSRDIQTLMALAEAGRFDELAPQEMARLEAYLNGDQAAAARFANQRPPPARELAPRVAAPAGAAWARVWGEIDAATRAAPRVRTIRLWRAAVGLMAAAACIVLAVIWSAGGRPPGSRDALHLVAGAEIQEIEVFDDATPFIVSAGDDGEIPVIWVMGDSGEGT